MSLIDNLNAINNCKEGIKNALINKGVDMTNVSFSDYAKKINELQLESGDEPSVPTPSVDYIYSNVIYIRMCLHFSPEKTDIIC